MNEKRNEPMNRRDFFRAGRGWLGEALVGMTEAAGNVRGAGEPTAGKSFSRFDKSRGLLRPPGALPEADFMAACTQCDDCIDACPEEVLFAAPAEAGMAAGTPLFNPAHKACFLCSDLHCIAVCKEGALLTPSTITEIAIGSARINPSLCHAFDGAECRFCIDVCPLPGGMAITLVDHHPQINAGLCVGCGLCEYYCKQNANRRAIVTSSLRPTPPLNELATTG